MKKHALLIIALSASISIAHAQRGRGNQQGGSSIENTLYLQGTVTLPDGSPPPGLATVARVCRGQAYSEGFTEPNGQFNVRVGTNAIGAIEDASTYGTDSQGRASGDTARVGGLTGDTERFSALKNKGSMDLIGCDLRITLDGFRPTSIPLTRRSIFDDPNLGTFVLRPIGSPDPTVSATSMTAPKTALKAYEKGRKELSKQGGDPAKAAKELEKAVAAHESFADAWNLLGSARLKMRDETGSLEAYRRAVEADPGYGPPYPALVKLTVRSGDWPSVEAYCSKYIELDPSAAEERFYLGLSRLQQGKLEDAEQALDQILADETMTQSQPGALHLKGVILGNKGQFPQAAATLERFLAVAGDAPQAAEVRGKLAEWKALGVLEP